MNHAATLPAAATFRRPSRRSVPFWGLMIFTFVLFVAPQNHFPVLEPLMLAKLSIGLTVIAYLANRAMTGRALTTVTPAVRWALLLAGIAILSIPAGFWPGGSVDVFLDLFIKSVIVFLIIANVVDTPRRARTLVGAMIAWGTITALWALGNYLGGHLDQTGTRIAGYESPLAVNPNDLALTLNILFAFALGLRPLLRHRLQRTALLAVMGLLTAGIVVTFSRSGFVTLLVVGAMAAARGLRERGGRALPAIALAVIAVSTAIPSGYSDRLSTIVDPEADTTGSSDERWQTMKTAFSLMAHRPILGYGIGNNLHVSVATGGMSKEAHNAYLKLGAELGVGGLAVYVLFIVAALRAARDARKRLTGVPNGEVVRHLAGGVELALIAFAVGALFSPVPYHFYLYFPAGLAVALHTMARRLAPDHSRKAA